MAITHAHPAFPSVLIAPPRYLCNCYFNMSGCPEACGSRWGGSMIRYGRWGDLGCKDDCRMMDEHEHVCTTETWVQALWVSRECSKHKARTIVHRTAGVDWSCGKPGPGLPLEGGRVGVQTYPYALPACVSLFCSSSLAVISPVLVSPLWYPSLGVSC